MRYFSLFKTFFLVLLLLVVAQVAAQQTVVKPTILYTGNPHTYTIGGINLSGVDNYEPYVIIGISGLSVGDVIDVPGDAITTAVKNYWKHGLFADVSIEADSIVGNKIYLGINLKQRPRISNINYNGVKKGEREDLELKLPLRKGNQITPNIVDRAKKIVKQYFEDKGYNNAEVVIMQRPDVTADNQMIVDVNVDKKEKIKINRIYINGVEEVPLKKIKYAMKMRERVRWSTLKNTFLRSKKFTPEKYKEDKENILSRYAELGYRDARIVSDSVVPYDAKHVDIHINVEEGNRYYLRSVKWVGNSVFSTAYLDYLLRLKPGDVYNQTELDKRLFTDTDAVKNEYYNKGYVFLHLLPIEVSVVNDSVDLEIRMSEGVQATIDRVRISGNERLYEDVVRRELRTVPGDLFSMTALERSFREIANMGHFNPETIQPDVLDNREAGTVDINWGLETKSSDQIELSAGWGQTGVIGKLSLKLTNFSMRNLFRKGSLRRGILPQGDGQTLTLSAQSNGKYYQAYSISFFDPWFGRKRPNSLSVSAFMSIQTDVADSYYNSAYYNNYNNYLYGYGNYNGYGYGYNNMASYYDPDKYIRMYGFSIGWGRPLKWPDDYFTLSAELNYQLYSLKDWQYFLITDGNCNNINLSMTLSRRSIDNPYFPRQGSDFSLQVSATPPYSLWDGKDYASLAKNPKNSSYKAELRDKHKWIEYYKIKFRSKTFTSLTEGKHNLVLMTRADFGILGSYDKHKKSPFETFYVGGDGMSGYSYNYATDMVALRGYENGSLTPYGYEGYAYTRLGLELRFPFMLQSSTTIYGLAFVEGGNSWADASKFNLFDLKRSAGVGIRVFLQMIGLIGLDWAYGFDDVYGSTQYSGSQFHFILGQEF
ncbi:MAG: BamA/TamA family outer membrane protein [Bacteroidaceae bacterium]|nr:BamA/TamA family outer membrane protein [Bacteroidaceae bacterium]